MAYDIGTARGVIEMDYNGRGVTEAEASLKGLEEGSGKTKGALDKTAKAAAIGGAAIAGGLALAVNAAADFEQRMSAVEAVSGASGSQMDALRGKALQLGKDTQFSASESAQAIEELVKAGISIPDVLNGAADAVVNLAAAGEIDMPQAATISANAMNQFGLSAKDMVGVVDNIAGAANASAIDVSDFGQSLQQVGAVANLAGVNFQDTATAIAIMGNAGIKGSDAGTSLKSMFARLQPQTDKATNALAQMGIITKDGSNKFYDAQGNLKGLAQVAGLMQKGLRGMTKEQKQATLQTVFGSDAIRAAAILSNAGAKGFDKMAASMGKVSAADVAAKRMDNFKGSLEQMKGSLETAGIAVGTILLPPLRQLVDAITQALNWFLNLGSGTQTAVVAFLATASAVLLVVAAIIKIVRFVQEAIAVFEVLQVALEGTWLAALGPIGLIIAAIALVVAIIVILWKKNETFRAIVTAVWNAIKAVIMSVVNWIMGVPAMFESAWNAIKTGVAAVVNFIRAHWMLLVEILLGPLGLVIALVRAFWPQIKAIFNAGVNALLAVWRAFWGVFGGIIRAAFGLIVAIVRLEWTIIKGVFLLAMMGIKAATLAVWHAIAAAIRAVWGVIRAIVSAGAHAVQAVVSAVWGAIRGVTSSMWNAIKAAVAGPISAIRSVVSAGVNAAKSVLSSAWNAAHAATVSMWNAMKSAVSSAINGIMSLVSGIQGRVVGALSGAASWLYNAGKAIIQGLLDGIESMIGAVTSKINSVTDKISSFLPGSPVKEGPLRKLNRGKAGKEIIQFVIDGIDKMSAPLADAMGSAMPVPPAPSRFAVPAGAGGRPTPPTGGGRTAGLRLVDGELRLHKSGKAFITGLAMDADQDDHDYSDTLGRMGRG